MIFVSYSWINNEPDMDVLNFVAYLRKKGFPATCDVMYMQEETAISFPKMMAQKLKEADKVIIILSKEYKEKADSFQGGVGAEYNYILSDIEKNIKKYILVTFDTDIQKVTPDFIKEREVVPLIKDDERTYEKVFYKLQDKPEFIFPEIGQSVSELKQKTVAYEEEINFSVAYESSDRTFEYKGESFELTEEDFLLIENFLSEDCFSHDDNTWIFAFAKDAIRILNNLRFKGKLKESMDSLKKYFDNIEDKKNACHLVYEQMYWIFMKNNKQIRVNKLNAYVNFALKTLEQAEGDIWKQMEWNDHNRFRLIDVKKMIARYIKIGQIKIEKSFTVFPLFERRIQLLEELYVCIVDFITEIDNYLLQLSVLQHRRNQIVYYSKKWKEAVLFGKYKPLKCINEFEEQIKSYFEELFEIMNHFFDIVIINEEYFEHIT